MIRNQILAHLRENERELVVALRKTKGVRPAGDQVILEIVAAPDGRFASVKVVKASGYPRLDAMARRLIASAGPISAHAGRP